jgi:hypothetical protein
MGVWSVHLFSLLVWNQIALPHLWFEHFESKHAAN